MGRLRSGVSPQQAQSEMAHIAARVAPLSQGAIDPRRGVELESLEQYAVSGTVRTSLMLLGAVPRRIPVGQALSPARAGGSACGRIFVNPVPFSCIQSAAGIPQIKEL